MKKILFLLLCTVQIYGQVSTGQEQSFPYGILNESLQTITTPPYLTTTGMDGTQGKIPSALIEKTDNKQNSLAVDGTGTKYPTVDAVNAAILLKQNTLNWKTPQDYGAIGNGIADDTAAIQACFLANENVLLYGTYFISGTLDIRENHTIFSNGAVIKKNTSSSPILKANNTNQWSILGRLHLLGNRLENGDIYTELSDGLLVIGGIQWSISGVTSQNFSGTGLKFLNGVAVSRSDRGVVSDCFAINNCKGVFISAEMQYLSFTNLNVRGNTRLGVEVLGGNNSFTGGNIGDNANGLYIGGTYGNNNSHGIINGVNINHNDLNGGYNIMLDNVELGETFTGCHIYGGSRNIEIINSKGALFNGCIIDGPIVNTDANEPKGHHLFSTCQMESLTIPSGDRVYFKNCFLKDGVDFPDNDFDWGLSGSKYMYAGKPGQKFAFSMPEKNILYSGGVDGFSIQNKADNVSLVSLTNSGNMTVTGSFKSASVAMDLSDLLTWGDGYSFGSPTILGSVGGIVFIPQGVVSGEAMRITKDNAILIGTTTDDGINKLQVNGSISATSYTGSATLTGTPTAPTAPAGTNTTQIATTAFVDAGLATKQNTITNPTTGVGSQNDPNAYALQDGTILYHSVKWFTPTSTVSTSGTTVTSVGTQFTNAMVGAKLTINGEWRIITGYTSSTVVTVASAYSQNYSAVVAGSWGVYSKAYVSSGLIGINTATSIFFNPTGVAVTYIDQNGNYQVTPTFAIFVGTVSSSMFTAASNINLATNSNVLFNANGQVGTGGTKDIGIRRNSAGLLELYNGVTADGTLTNRRDLLVRNVYSEPATLPNQVVTKTQLDLKADLASPTFTGTPTAPTAAPGTNTTQIATTAFVQTAKASVLSDDNTFTGSQVFNDTVNFNNIALLKSYTVSTLPTGMIRGAIAYVTDALAPTYMTTVVGGGSVVCPVFYNGTAWVAH